MTQIVIPIVSTETAGGSSLTVREVDGTPSGSATELVLPNGSLSFSGSVATADLVGNGDSRLGVIWDETLNLGTVALSCDDQQWTFADTTTRDNLRTALQAVATTDDRLGVVYDPTNEDAALSCNNQLWTFLDGTTRDNLRTALEAAAATHTHDASAITAGTLADARLSTNIPRMVGGLIQASNLPSYVDDVLEFANLAAFPATGETGKIYVALNTNLTYRWSGSAYVEISPSTAVWGSISGTLSSQTDLQSALDAKLNTSTAANSLLGNNTGSTASATSLTAEQVRTLLGLATTDTPQFSGVQLGTSGFLVGGTNLIEQRNGTNGQIARWAKTWTSATNNELFEIDCAGNATTFDLAVCSGSAGGTNRGLRFGQKFAGGAFSSWASFATTGSLTISGADQVLNLSSSTSFSLVRCFSAATPTRFLEFGWANSRYQVAAQGNFELEFQTNNTRRFVISGAGDSEFLSDLTIRPSASRTPTVNGQFTIEMTSNTAGNLVYRGSDGTTRRCALTFV